MRVRGGEGRGGGLQAGQRQCAAKAVHVLCPCVRAYALGFAVRVVCPCIRARVCSARRVSVHTCSGLQCTSCVRVSVHTRLGLQCTYSSEECAVSVRPYRGIEEQQRNQEEVVLFNKVLHFRRVPFLHLVCRLDFKDLKVFLVEGHESNLLHDRTQ